LIGNELFEKVERGFKKMGWKKYILGEIPKIFYQVYQVA
jgi:hypothetical protein